MQGRPMSSRSRWFAASFLFFSLWILPATAERLPALVQGALPQARLVGQGSLTWFGFQVYDARLWVKGRQWSFDAPFALELRYARSIPGERLAETSAEEMRRMALGSEEQLMRWLAAMRRIFPDVAAGDRLIGVHLPGDGVVFYSAGRILGSIPDAEFARAFFAIWLDERTRRPELRAALLGSQ